MSSNRLIYDSCAYKKTLDESVGPFSYSMFPAKYENCAKCRIELGQVGGNGVSIFSGNLVDLDSELRGQTRIISKCGTNQYVPTNDGIIKNDKTQPIDTTMLHLPACQSIMYREVPMPPKINYNKCQ
jgi:hypothetical protein